MYSAKAIGEGWQQEVGEVRLRDEGGSVSFPLSTTAHFMLESPSYIPGTDFLYPTAVQFQCVFLAEGRVVEQEGGICRTV